METISLIAHTGYINFIAWSSRFLASGSDDSTIRVWDTQQDFACVKVITDHIDWVRSIAWSPCGRFLASGSADKTIRVWDSQADFACIRVLTSHTNWVNSIVWSGRFLASGSWDKAIQNHSLTNSIGYDYNTKKPYKMLSVN
jgi:WD40 repeat protein